MVGIFARITEIELKEFKAKCDDLNLPSIYEGIKLAIRNLIRQSNVTDKDKIINDLQNQITKDQEDHTRIIHSTEQELQELQSKFTDQSTLFSKEKPETLQTIREIFRFALYYNTPTAPKKLSQPALDFILKFMDFTP